MLSKIEKDVLRFLLLMLIVLFGCKLTDGWFAWLLAIIGCGASLYDKVNITITCYVILPLLIYFSPVLVAGSQLGIAARIGPFIILLGMLLTSATKLSAIIRNRKEDFLPIGWLFVYSMIAVISSVIGWMPLISFFKILNFVLFVFGLIILSKLIQASNDELYQMRVILLGLVTFIVVGSVIAYYIPSIGYSMLVSKAAGWGKIITGSEVSAQEGYKLFNGVMNHSQSLGIILPLCFGWILCDMLLVERRLSRLHLIVIFATPVLMFMSRSRASLLGFSVSLLMIYCCCIPLISFSTKIKRKIKRILYVFLACIVTCIIFAQIHNKTLSKWIRKVDNLETDYRNVGESLTSSRMGLVEYNRNDFKLNPIFGKGFQVMNWHEAAYREKRISLLSAPIEKGIIPLMVLGETGIIGFLIFVVFLFSFYKTCIRKRYRVLLCSFTTLMALNMSESTFFSPGGSAMQWTIAVIGGFTLDLLINQEKTVDSSFPAQDKVLN